MDGLEGIKLLETIFKNEPSCPGAVLLFAVMLSCGLVLSLSCLIAAFQQQESSLLLFLLIGIPLMVGSFIFLKSDSVQVKYYKITPIEEKYFIDLTKYDIIETTGEIITIKEKEQ